MAAATSRRYSPARTVFAWSEVWPRRRCRAASDVGALRLRTRRDQGPPVRRFPAQIGRGGRPGGVARSRLLGADAALAGGSCSHVVAFAGARRVGAHKGGNSSRRPDADREFAHRPGSVSSTASIAMVRATRRAVVSGTMPMPTLHSTSRHTASKLRNCTRSRSGCPIRAALSARKRCSALARSSPTKSWSSTSREAIFGALGERMLARHHQHEPVLAERIGFERARHRRCRRRCRDRRRLRRSGRRSRRSAAPRDRR